MAKVQKRFVELQKLLQIKPYKIVGLWSNGETRLNDFTDEVEEWRNGSNKELKKLANAKVFHTAFIRNGTLAFSGSTVRVPGIPGPQPVDFDRRVLYADSQLIGTAVTYEEAIHHQKNRLNRHKHPLPLPGGFKVKPQKSNNFRTDTEPINKISQKIGIPLAPLIVIGDELVELENIWTFSDL